MDDSFLLEGLNRLMVEAYALPNQADIYKKIEELQRELQRLYAQKNATGERPLSESQLNGLLRTWSNMEFNMEKLRQEVLCISSGPLSLAFQSGRPQCWPLLSHYPPIFLHPACGQQLHNNPAERHCRPA